MDVRLASLEARQVVGDIEECHTSLEARQEEVGDTGEARVKDRGEEGSSRFQRSGAGGARDRYRALALLEVRVGVGLHVPGVEIKPLLPMKRGRRRGERRDHAGE